MRRITWKLRASWLGSGRRGSEVQILLAPTNFFRYFPVTWVTDYSEHIGNTFGPKGFAIGSSLFTSSNSASIGVVTITLSGSLRMGATRQVMRANPRPEGSVLL